MTAGVQQSGSSQEASTFQFDFSDLETELSGLNMEIVGQQLRALGNQFNFQDQVFGASDSFLGQIGREREAEAGLFTREELRTRALDQQDRADRMFASQDELLQMELERIRGGAAATDEQKALINASTEAAIASGTADIDSFVRDNVDFIRNELAPSRGLRPSDTPIQDRGFRVGEEATRQHGQLVSDLRGAQASAELNFPLAQNAQSAGFSQFQQGLAQSASNFQDQLNQQMFGNFVGSSGNLGLGLVGASQPQAGLQQAFKPQLGQESSGSSSGQNIMFSSKSMKTNKRPIDEIALLNALMTLSVEKWEYISSGLGEEGDRIGPYAEDFAAAFGIGTGHTINYGDAIGVLIAAVQALGDKVKQLEAGNQ